jgi:hypothetical protein
MRRWTISERVDNPRNNDAELITPFTPTARRVSFGADRAIVLSRAGSVLRHPRRERPAASMQSRSTIDVIARLLLLAEC